MAQQGAQTILLPAVATAGAQALTLVQSIKRIASDVASADPDTQPGLAALGDAATKLETIYTTLTSLFNSTK